jgi:ACS family glucarate transporter-like MFS transporter
MPEAGTTHVRWFLIFWLFVLSAVAYLDRVNISIAGSSIASEFHLSDVQLGRVFSAFLIGYGLFQTLGGWLADRLGPHRVLTLGVLWWGIFTAITAAVSSRIASAVLIFAAVRFLLGAGEAVIYPASNQFVSRWIPVQERGIANGLIFSGVGVGAGVTPTLITYIMLHYGWRWSFWVSALIGLLAGAIWFLAARDTPEQHPRVSSAELRHIQSGLSGPSSASGVNSEMQRTVATRRVSWKNILVSKNVWAVTLSYFCFGYVAWIFFSWFFIYLARVRGLDLKVSAFYTTLPFLAMAACSPIGGAVSDRLSKLYGARAGRCAIAAFAFVLTAVFLTVGSRVASARLASIVLAGGAGALYLSQSSFWSVTAGMASGSSGSVSGFMNMGNQVGGALTAALTPVIAKNYGWTTSFLVAAALALLGAVAWLFVDPERHLVASPLPS